MRPLSSVVSYEVWTPFSRPNFLIPCGPYELEAKVNAMAAYRSQCAIRDFRAGMIGLNAYRGVFLTDHSHAEAFMIEWSAYGRDSFTSLFEGE